MPKPYPSEFRRRALDLLTAGRSVVEVAEMLGIEQSCLYRWRSLDLVDRGLKSNVAAVESKCLANASTNVISMFRFGIALGAQPNIVKWRPETENGI